MTLKKSGLKTKKKCTRIDSAQSKAGNKTNIVFFMRCIQKKIMQKPQNQQKPNNRHQGVFNEN